MTEHRAPRLRPDAAYLGELQRQARRAGRALVVRAVVVRDGCEVFLRWGAAGPDPATGRWGVVGGRPQPGEGLVEALERELASATGWRLARIERVVAVRDRVAGSGDPAGSCRELVLAVAVDGDLDHPRAGAGGPVRHAWVDAAGLDALERSGGVLEAGVSRAARAALSLAAR